MPQMTIYRPLEDGGPEPPEGSEYTSIMPDFWIVEGHGLPWQQSLSNLDSLFAIGDGVIVGYQPWWPGTATRAATFRQAYPVSAFSAGAVVAESEPGGGAITQLHEVREACGSDKSGLWLIASPTSRADLKRLIDPNRFAGPPSTIAAEIATATLASLSLDEARFTTLMVRRSHPLFDTFVAVVSRLPGLP